jgi:hypothetical protein
MADILGVSERAVRYARKELLQLGIITADTGSHQRKLNRTGAYFTVNVGWKPAGKLQADQSKKGGISAPPYKTKKTPYGSKNQKATVGRSGAQKSTEQKKRGLNILPEHLRDLRELESVYRKIIARKVMSHSESSVLNFLSAAVKARSFGERGPKIFMGLIKRQLWSHISNQDESRARVALNRVREIHCDMFRVGGV